MILDLELHLGRDGALALFDALDEPALVVQQGIVSIANAPARPGGLRPPIIPVEGAHHQLDAARGSINWHVGSTTVMPGFSSGPM